MIEYRMLSNKPYSVLINPQLVSDRLSASSYNTNFLKYLDILKSAKLSYFQLDQYFNVSAMIGWKNLTTDDYVENGGVKLLRVSDIKTGFVVLDNAVSASSDKIMEQPQIHLKQGDIVFSKDGTLGISSVVPKIDELICAGSTLARIRKKSGKNIDEYFISSFLNSFFTTSQISYYISGIAQPHITQEYIKKIKVPVPEFELQSYIGSKVRLAEKYREEAINSRKKINDLLIQHANLTNIEQEFAVNKKQLSHQIGPCIVDDRIDSEFYQPSYLAVDKTLKSRAWFLLDSLIEFPIKGLQPQYDPNGSIPALTGTHIDPNQIDIESPRKVTKEWAETKPKAQAKKGEILITVTGPPLGEAAVVHNYHCPLGINSHIARVKTKKSFPYPFYIAAILNSAIGSIQVYRHCKGVRQKELYPEQICQFVIPEVDQAIVEQIDHLCNKADIFEQKSKKLIFNAKSDVEKLIEGKLDTQGIISGRIKAPTWKEVEALIENEIEE